MGPVQAADLRRGSQGVSLRSETLSAPMTGGCSAEVIDLGSEEEQPHSAQGRPCRARSSSGLETKDSPGRQAPLHAIPWAACGVRQPGPVTLPSQVRPQAQVSVRVRETLMI